MMERLRCGKCRELVQYADHVYLDRLNTVIHQRCYTINIEVKDKGTLRYIMNKYKYF